MRIKRLYIFLTVLSISLLLGSVAFIYFDGNKSIQIQREDNSDQISKSLLFMDFIAKYKAYARADHRDVKGVSFGYSSFTLAMEKLQNSLEGQALKGILNLGAVARELNQLFLRDIRTNLKLSRLASQKNTHWLKIESRLSTEVISRMKKSKEFMPEFKKTLGKWAQNISFFEKVRDSIDVSYVGQDEFKELQSLMNFSQWLVKAKDNELSTDLDNKLSLSVITEKVELIESSSALKKSLLLDFKKYFESVKSLKNMQNQKIALSLKIKKYRKEGAYSLNDEVFPSWKEYIASKYENNITQRYKRHKRIVDTGSIIGAVVIVCMLIIFLNIFPYLGRLESKARQVAAGDFQASFKDKVPNNEIGEVMKAFNDMSSEISKHLEELRQNENEKILLTDSIQKMRKVSELGEFSAKMAHELKNPISILTFCLSDAVEHLSRGAIDQCSSELEKSIKALERLKVTASKLGSKEIASKREKIELDTFLIEVQSMYRALIEKEGISLTLDLPSTSVSVIGPRLEMLGAISNLMDNAIEHLKEHRRDPQEIHLSLSSKGELGTIKISNAGIGIEEPERIFNNFYSTKASNTRGLGLVIVKDVVESVGGNIQYSYEFGLNTFKLELPIV